MGEKEAVIDIKPNIMLSLLRGEHFGLCGCGRTLIPSIHNGKQIGVTHKPDDDDWHCQFFAGFTLEIGGEG